MVTLMTVASSHLIQRAHSGEEVVIGRGDVPVARLTLIVDDVPKRRPGTLRGVVKVPKSFFDSSQKDLHTSMSSQCGFDALVTDQTPGIHQAGPNIVRLEPGRALQDGLRCVPGRKHAEHMLDGRTMSPNNGLAAKDRDIGRDPREQFVIANRRVLLHTGP